MKIGVDAKWYFSGPPSGVNVVRNIVDNMIINDTEDQIVFFLNKKDIDRKLYFEEKIKNYKNLSFEFINLSLLTKLLLFPFMIWNKKMDVILFQNFIPLWGGRRTKFVVYIHDLLFLDFPQYFSRFERIAYRIMLLSAKRSSHVITISESERNRILKHADFPEEKVSYVYHGIDPVFYERSKPIRSEVRIKYNLPDKYILFVGRINVRKNISTLLKAYNACNQDISLVIVGKEEHKGYNLLRDLNQVSNNAKIHKIGFVPDNDLAEIISGATIFVFPSYAEGFGLPPLEAMKSGVPTIISNTTSLPEVCGDAAISFNPDDYVELTSKMVALLSDAELYHSYKVKGLNQAEVYSWERSVNSILKILRNL